MEADAERPPNLRCRSCGAAIFWTLTENGKRMPMDAVPTAYVASGQYVVVWPSEPSETPRALHAPMIHLTHFATCPNAAAHRKPRGGVAERPAGEQDAR